MRLQTTCLQSEISNHAGSRVWMKNSLYQLVSRQVSRFSGLEFQWPSFPDSLEAQFEAATSDYRCKRLWLEGLLAIGLYDFFLVADHLGSSEQFWRAVVTRLLLVTPLALAVNYLMLTRPHPVLRETSIAAVTALAGLSHLYLESKQNLVTSAFAQFGLLAAIVFANTAMRLRFPYALASSASMIAGDLIFLHQDIFLQPDQKLFGLGLTLGTVAVTVIANYSSNREERLGYLLRLRSDVMVEDLNLSVERLSYLAEKDALTGLANRHAFDIQFERLWNAAVASGAPMSLVMVDIDFFKQRNDLYGHLYGDKILIRIAHLISETLPKEHDFAARFGGDEFVILLPYTSSGDAFRVAERLRLLVEVAGAPPLDSSSTTDLQDVTATVSCGIAALEGGVPRQRQDLIELADKALYQAKTRGRNCVA
jgi:diguanylate cyclase (GGDEF)-like protein